jgi:hypothetical protein
MIPCSARMRGPRGFLSAMELRTSPYPRTWAPYRLELLPVVPPCYRRAWGKELEEGQLVYYGPMPAQYGIGEVVRFIDHYVVVDFRGTGQFGVHQEVLEPQYVLPIPPERMGLL